MVSRVVLGAVIRVGPERSQTGLADVWQVRAELRAVGGKHHLLLVFLSLGTVVISMLVQYSKTNSQRRT